MKRLFIILGMVLPVVFAMAQTSERFETFSTVATGDDGKPCPGAVTVNDIDGNVYNTVIIGKQCWMKENLRTTRYADGITIPLGTSTSSTTAYRYAPGTNMSNEENMVNVNSYGYLYNWLAVMHGANSSDAIPSGVRGACPAGWHVPSKAEWAQLIDYIEKQPVYLAHSISKSLAATWGWVVVENYDEDEDEEVYGIGNNPSENNATGFSALPAGGYDGVHYGYKSGFGGYVGFWSATQDDNDEASVYDFDADNNHMSENTYYKKIGLSVRCLRD